MSWIRWLETLVMPPTGPWLLMVVGAVLLWARRRGGWTVFGTGAVALYLLATPLLSMAMASWLEDLPVVTPAQIQSSGAEAIVVISADSYLRGPEYGGSTSGHYELERLRYAAYLQRRTGLPVAVIGAKSYLDGQDSSAWMQSILEDEFGAPVRWAATDSVSTLVDARRAKAVLRPDGIERIVLVTHASHMRRAAWSFEKFGFKVIAAPTVFSTRGGVIGVIPRLTPSSRSMEQNTRLLHELLGLIWYRWMRN